MVQAYYHCATCVATLSSSVVILSGNECIYRLYLLNFCKTLILLCCIIACKPVAAQKVFPVTKSALSGISIPVGSRQDKRMLMVGAAQLLLEMEAKSFGATIQNTEVLYLPVAEGTTYNIETFTSAATQAGWQLSAVEGTKEYFWLQQNQRVLICYFSVQKKQVDIYTADTNGLTPQNNTTSPPAIDSTIVNTNNPLFKDSTTITTNNSAPPVVNTVIAPINNTDFQYNTTNFDNGWVSNVFDNYVQVTKGTIKVLLSYREKFNESEYSGTGKEKGITFWNSYVGKYFTLGEAMIRPRTTFSDYSRDYVEGWATDKQTGEKRFVAMMLNIFPYTGVLSIVVASAPDDQQLKQAFPKADREFDNDLLPMYGYNKFAVGPNDLKGSWSTSGGGTTSWYSGTTGQYVGATGAATADIFKFNGDGTYNSEHKGGYGVVGSMATYQQKYKGTYTVTNWSVTIDHRWDNKTQVCEAWFEVIKGGRILHLNEGSLNYKLMKE